MSTTPSLSAPLGGVSGRGILGCSAINFSIRSIGSAPVPLSLWINSSISVSSAGVGLLSGIMVFVGFSSFPKSSKVLSVSLLFLRGRPRFFGCFG